MHFFLWIFWRTSIPWVNWDKLHFAFCSINPSNWRGKPYNFDRLLIAILIFWLKMSQCIKLVLKNNLWLGKRLLRVWIKERETWISCFLKCRLSYAGPTGWPFLFLQWWALWIKEVPLLNSLSPCSLYETVQFTKKAVDRENTYSYCNLSIYVFST